MSTDAMPLEALGRASASNATRERPVWHTVLLLCLGQVLLWSLASGLTYKAPEIDSAEQFTWSFSMENGYWKHPPVPSWLMHGLLQVFGPSVVLPFAAAQVSTVLALFLTWRLGCEFMSQRRALVAVVLTSLVTYHNLGADNFNHNTALLPFQAAMVLTFYLATRRRSLYLWALVGLYAGLSMMVKYVALMPIAGLLLYLALDRALHHRLTLQGLAVAALVSVAVLVPHAIWLQTTNFLPFRYAHSVTLPLQGWAAQLSSLGAFAGIQLVRVWPLVLGLLYLRRLCRRSTEALQPTPALNPSDRLFLWVATLSPLVLTVVYCVATRTELVSRWGANAFLLAGLLAMAVLRMPVSRLIERSILRAVIAAHVVLCLSLVLGKTVVAEHFHWRTRANFPGGLLARNAMEEWRKNTSVPLRIVVSDIWLGGNIVAHSSGSPRVAVLIDGHYFKSPWVNAEAIRTCGAMVLDDQTRGATGSAANSPELNRLMEQASVSGAWNMPWAVSQAQATESGTGVVRWGIILPSEPGSCMVR
jgi:hypothetical protein